MAAITSPDTRKAISTNTYVYMAKTNQNGEYLIIFKTQYRNVKYKYSSEVERNGAYDVFKSEFGASNYVENPEGQAVINVDKIEIMSKDLRNGVYSIVFNVTGTLLVWDYASQSARNAAFNATAGKM